MQAGGLLWHCPTDKCKASQHQQASSQLARPPLELDDGLHRWQGKDGIGAAARLVAPEQRLQGGAGRTRDVSGMVTPCRLGLNSTAPQSQPVATCNKPIIWLGSAQLPWRPSRLPTGAAAQLKLPAAGRACRALRHREWTPQRPPPPPGCSTRPRTCACRTSRAPACAE